MCSFTTPCITYTTPEKLSIHCKVDYASGPVNGQINTFQSSGLPSLPWSRKIASQILCQSLSKDESRCDYCGQVAWRTSPSTPFRFDEYTLNVKGKAFQAVFHAYYSTSPSMADHLVIQLPKRKVEDYLEEYITDKTLPTIDGITEPERNH